MADEQGDQSYMNRVLKQLSGVLDELPKPVRSAVKREIEELHGLLHERRSPRVMVLGRRGAGKSQLINAIASAKLRPVGHVTAQTGAAKWETLQFGGRSVEVLDTRGVQEGSQPTEEDPNVTVEESLRAAISDHCPDVILFCVQARQVDSAINADLDFAEMSLRAALDEQGDVSEEARVKIIPVLTQCDQMEPSDVRLDEGDPEKMQHVNEAVEVFNRHLRGRDFLWKHVASGAIPVCASFYLFPDERVNPNRDYRWGIERLAVQIAETIPSEALLEFTRLAQFRQIQEKLAKRVVLLFAGICGATGLSPMPVADMPIITSLQIMMVVVIAYISGREMSLDTARDFLAGLGINVGAGFVLREAARALVKIIPVAGNVISGTIASGATKVIGNAAISYYIGHKSMSDVQKKFKRGLREIEAT
ncbi:uncharacterized protein (DUF697 family) [Actinomadura pelletieri DSM 43383]|uniref:Uncharacterized protein (DUF697 family) n=2 Tax=Actinomadura pelletieri TaxID=111805 RepID=A0A495QZT2_9ACTN|nr:uncharacterized protein (DUF697 family) [Actinomadura pelletieri DSM 43383]